MFPALVLGVLLITGPLQDRIIPGGDGFIEVAVPVNPEAVAIRLTSDSPASVTETRRVTLEKGINHLRHDWSRGRVDGGSIHFALRAAAGKAEIVARRTVSRLPKLIYLDVSASEPTEAELLTSYRLSGVGWRVDYEAILPAAGDDNATPAVFDLRASARITNGSGLDLEGCRCLFEGGEIASLTLKNGEHRRIDVLRAKTVPLIERYIYDPARFGGTPGIEYEVANDRGGPLGQTLMPSGRIRVFAPDREGRPALLGESIFPATLMSEKAKFSIGHARDLVVERTVVSQVNENERRDRWNKVVAYDQRVKVRFKVRSGFDRPVSITLMERPGAPLEVVSCTAESKLKKADTIEIQLSLDPRSEQTVDLEWLRKNLF